MVKRLYHDSLVLFAIRCDQATGMASRAFYSLDKDGHVKRVINQMTSSYYLWCFNHSTHIQ